MNKRTLAFVLCLLLTAGINQSAPLEPVFFDYNGVTLRTDGDEHGLVTRDVQGRVAKQDGNEWYYAVIDSSAGEPCLIKYSVVSLAGIAPELAAYSDPEVDARIRAFNATAPLLESYVFLGEMRVTVIYLTFAPFAPANFWNGPLGQMIDAQFTYDQIFSQNLRAEYPSDSARTNLTGDVIYGSVAEWFEFNSGGLVHLVPDLSRYPTSYVGNPDQPGVITDPLNPGQAIPIPASLFNDVVVFETLEARGIDCTPDPRRPILFVNRSYWNSRADFSGLAWLNLYYNIQGQALLTPGIIAHEICHASFGLPDLYNDMAELKNAFQMMSLGCQGYQYQDSSGVFRRHRGFPGLIEEPFAEVLGWRETLPITAPGVYTFDVNFSPFCIQNPTDPREKIFIRSWNDLEGWTSRHQPLTSDGRLLIEYTDFHRPATHYFQDLPAPFLKWSNQNSEVWPTGGQHIPGLNTWNNGAWFPWIIDADECRANQPRSFEILERPAPYPCVSMVYQDLMEEVPLGGSPISLELLNMGTAFSGWTVSIGDMSVSGEETVVFNQSFTVSFPSTVWNASTLSQILDLPVTLTIQSLDTSLVVGRLQPFVGLAPAEWSLAVNEDVVTAASGRYHLVTDGSGIQLFVNGQQRAEHSLLNAREICFASDPHRAVARGQLNGSDFLTILAVDDDVVDILVSIFCSPGVSAYALTEWDDEEVLVFVRGDQLEVRRLYGSHEPIFQYTLPDYILPVKQMACAFGDPAGDLGLRMGMIGGAGNNWTHVTNVFGDTLYSRFAGECAELRNILALDPLGSGYYSFAVDNMVCADGNWDLHYNEELWLVTYSADLGHYGMGVFPLGIYNSTSEDGAEDFVPYPNGDFPYRHAILTNSHHPYYYFSEIQVLDVSRNTPELTVIAQEAPRNRWFSVGYFDADAYPDTYVFDRGAGLRFFRGAGGNGLGLMDSGRLHAFESQTQHPQFVEMNGQQNIIFYEDGVLRAYHLPFAQAPTYSGNGVGNQRFMPNPNWQSAGDSPLSPPRVRATFIPGNQVRLDIEPLALGQMASMLSVWSSSDQVSWEKVFEGFWDGLAPTSWVDQQALRGRHLGFYRVQVSNDSPDGQVFWNE